MNKPSSARLLVSSAIVLLGLGSAGLTLAADTAADPAAPAQPARNAARAPAKDPVKLRFINMLQVNPDIVSARLAAQSTEFGREAAQAGFYPKLSVGANASSSSTISNRQSTDVTVRQPLFSGGRLTSRLRQAEVDGMLAFSNLDRVTQDTSLDALLAHTQLQRQAFLVRAAKGGLLAVNDLLELEERRLELGGGGITDAQFAKARQAVAADRLATFEGQLDEAKATYLRYFYQISDGEKLPELDVAPSAFSGNLEALVKRALEMNPQISQTELQITRARFNYEAEFAALYPTLDLVAVQQFFKEKDPFTGKDTDSSVNLRLNYSAFSGGEQTAKIGKAFADIDAQRAQQASARMKVEENVRLQFGRRAAAMARAKALETAVTDALTVFKNRKRLRDFGRETAIAMLDAQVEYFNVLVAYLNAVFDARVASFRLLHATGEMRPAVDPAPWLDGFYTRNLEKVKLERSLAASEEVARAKTERNLADELGIKVDPSTADKAEKFYLSPDSELKPRPKKAMPPNSSNSERINNPSLRFSTDIDSR
ncbi:MAG: TolC family protein [Burkholderiales bacterium]|nr:TolC family protein [Burkholderiales bacterium]